MDGLPDLKYRQTCIFWQDLQLVDCHTVLGYPGCYFPGNVPVSTLTVL